MIAIYYSGLGFNMLGVSILHNDLSFGTCSMLMINVSLNNRIIKDGLFPDFYGYYLPFLHLLQSLIMKAQLSLFSYLNKFQFCLNIAIT